MSGMAPATGRTMVGAVRPGASALPLTNTCALIVAGDKQMSTEHRTSYRCSTADSSQKAVLKVGREQWIVDLLDQSSGGFAISTLEKVALEPGQTIALRTNVGWSECEVIRVSAEQQATRIGLRRLHELLDPRLEQELHRSSMPAFAARGLKGSASPLACILGAALCLVIGFWIVVSNSVWLPKLQELLKIKPAASQSGRS